MAKKGTQNRNSQAKNRSSQPGKSTTSSDKSQSPDVLVDESLNVAAKEAVDIDKVHVDGKATTSIDDLRRAAALYEAAAKAASAREENAARRVIEIESREEDLKEERAKLQDERRAVSEEKQRNSNERAELEKRTKGFEVREKELLEREMESERRSTELSADIYKRAHEEILTPLLDARSEMIEDVRKQLVDSMSRLTEQASRLDKREEELNERETQLNSRLHDLRQERAEWEEERESAENDAISEIRRQLERERRRTSRFEQDISRLEEVVAASEDLRSALGTEPTLFLGEVDDLRTKVRELETELRRRPPESIAQELDFERMRTSQLNSEMATLRTENERMKTEITSIQTLALERDRLARENTALYETTSAYEKRIEELTRQFNNLVKQSSDKPPFPECTAMDTRPSLQTPPANLASQTVALDRLVIYLQQALANRPQEDGPPLFFYQDDLRIFLAGLSMSRLHILDGVSGTGKTSLPIAIARALGGGFAKIEVQAGWRDNRDLLGYYNEFERHFREHEFTRSLYEALTPRHRDGLFFVVLDEMNLSKPEQYFADFLSLLEDREGADRSKTPSVLLNDQSVHPLPKYLHEPDRGGVELPLGDNVWFIGTANHDETTASFAPKTQSRAHMMELPRKPPTAADVALSQSSFREWGKTLSYASLLQAFDEAERQHAGPANDAADFFTVVLGVLEKFDEDMSWGPRITRQIRKFVPSVIAAGGTLGLAVDHLLYTKLVRRLRDSFAPEMRSARKELLVGIKDYWPCGEFGAELSRTVVDLERQISRS